MKIIKITFVLLLVTLTSCSVSIPGAPSDAFGVNPPKVVDEGKQSIEVGGGIAGEIFGFAASGYKLGYKNGVGDGLELGVGASYYDLDFEKKYYADDLDKSVYAIHAYLKSNPGGFRHANGYAGLGATFNEHASNINLNLGGSLGYENKYLVPYVATNVSYSNVLDREWIELEEEQHQAVDAGWLQLLVGLKLPFKQDGAFVVEGGYFLYHFFEDYEALQHRDGGAGIVLKTSGQLNF